MNRKYHNWKTSEINYLIATFPARDDAHYAERFQTTIYAVERFRTRLKLKREKYKRPHGPFTKIAA